MHLPTCWLPFLFLVTIFTVNGGATPSAFVKRDEFEALVHQNHAPLGDLLKKILKPLPPLRTPPAKTIKSIINEAAGKVDYEPHDGDMESLVANPLPRGQSKGRSFDAFKTNPTIPAPQFVGDLPVIGVQSTRATTASNYEITNDHNNHDREAVARSRGDQLEVAAEKASEEERQEMEKQLKDGQFDFLEYDNLEQLPREEEPDNEPEPWIEAVRETKELGISGTTAAIEVKEISTEAPKTTTTSTTTTRRTTTTTSTTANPSTPKIDLPTITTQRIINQEQRNAEQEKEKPVKPKKVSPTLDMIAEKVYERFKSREELESYEDEWYDDAGDLLLQDNKNVKRQVATGIVRPVPLGKTPAPTSDLEKIHKVTDTIDQFRLMLDLAQQVEHYLTKRLQAGINALSAIYEDSPGGRRR